MPLPQDCVSSPKSFGISKSDPSGSVASCQLINERSTLQKPPCPPLQATSVMLSLLGCFGSELVPPTWPQPHVNHGNHHGSARSHACPGQDAGWLQPLSTPTHPSWTPKSSGQGLSPTHAHCFAGGLQERFGGGMCKGTRWFTGTVPATLIGVPKEHTFTLVYLHLFISSSWEPYHLLPLKAECAVPQVI